MPVYVYECQNCGQVTEREYKITSYKKYIKCPGCSSMKTTLLPSGTTFALKGGGWGNTGYSVGKPAKKGTK